MPPAKFAAAQSASVPGDVRANVLRHLAFARAAAAETVSFLLFPELSLTGYELPRMKDCLVSPDDPSLEPVRAFASQAGMTIVAGAPVASDAGDKPSIGAICFHPDGTSTVYQKRFLHAGEEPYAAPGRADVHGFDLNGERVSLAICADTVHPEHPQWAREAGATVYAAGVLWSRAGYAADAALVQGFSAAHGFAALVANHAAPTGGYQPAGQSAFWGPGGQLLGTAPAEGEALLMAQARHDGWVCSCQTINA